IFIFCVDGGTAAACGGGGLAEPAAPTGWVIVAAVALGSAAGQTVMPTRPDAGGADGDSCSRSQCGRAGLAPARRRDWRRIARPGTCLQRLAGPVARIVPAAGTVHW